MVGMLAPEFEEVVTGEAEVREIFRVPRIGAIAGCYVRSGVITRGSKVRFLRDGTIIWKGAITSLQAVQGRRPRGPRGLRVRHRPVRLPGPQARRPHRDVRGAGDRPHLIRCGRPPPTAEPRRPPWLPSNRPSTSSSSSTRSARGAGSPRGGSPTCRPRRDYAVDWRFISLYVLNEDKEPSERDAARPTSAGCAACASLDQVRIDHGNDAVAAFYTALGTRIHVDAPARGAGRRHRGVHRRGARRRPGSTRRSPTHAHDESHDAVPARRDRAGAVAHRARRRHADPDVRARPGRARGQLLRPGDLQGAARRRGRRSCGTPSRRSPRPASPSSSARSAPSPTSRDARASGPVRPDRLGRYR